jgi:hypothetical protein
MTMDLWVTIYRFLVPLSVFRWPLAGGLLIILADTADVFLLEGFGFGFWTTPNYQRLDKLFDSWGLTLEWLVSRSWPDTPVRRSAAVLFAWRMAGVAMMELTGWRGWLLFAPNLFEYFYLVVLVSQRRSRGVPMTGRRAAWAIVLIALPSVLKEYIMHYRQFSTWAFVRDHLFFWLYK